MRIKKISSDKIVVQLTDSDLEYFDLDFDEREPQAADLHKFLFEVMELVKTETGFDPYNGGQVVVEAAMANDGMSLIISKIRTGKPAMTREEFARVRRIGVKASGKSECVTKEDLSDLVHKTGLGRGSGKRCRAKNTVIIFDSFSDFEKAVCVIPNVDFGAVALYRNGARYALIYPHSEDTQEANIMSEYAVHILKNDVVAYSVRESWQLVAENGALVLMAENLRKMN